MKRKERRKEKKKKKKHSENADTSTSETMTLEYKLGPHVYSHMLMTLCSTKAFFSPRIPLFHSIKPYMTRHQNYCTFY